MSDGAETVHYIVELPFGSPAFLHDVEVLQSFPRNPLYAVIHEACYASGVATRWSADRVFPEDVRDDPTFLTGEHVYPWMIEEYGALEPLAEAAQILAEHEWPTLYDVERLAANEVPAAAAIYAEDMYVPREFSEETAARHPRPPSLGDERVRARRPACERQRRPRAAARSRPGPGLAPWRCSSSSTSRGASVAWSRSTTSRSRSSRARSRG